MQIRKATVEDAGTIAGLLTELMLILLILASHNLDVDMSGKFPQHLAATVQAKPKRLLRDPCRPSPGKFGGTPQAWPKKTIASTI